MLHSHGRRASSNQKRDLPRPLVPSCRRGDRREVRHRGSVFNGSTLCLFPGSYKHPVARNLRKPRDPRAAFVQAQTARDLVVSSRRGLRIPGKQALPVAVHFLLDLFHDLREPFACEVRKRGAHALEEFFDRNLLSGLLGVVIEDFRVGDRLTRQQSNVLPITTLSEACVCLSKR